MKHQNQSDKIADHAIEHELFALLKRQDRPKKDIDLARKVYAFAYKCHEGQIRKSEEPYITHPVGVAGILAELNADTETICAGLLHDVIEDCQISPKDIETMFGQEICKIVEGVTKLGKLSFSSKEERQAENFRKLVIAIAEDVRVVLVKLADRLHNMRTMEFMPKHKQIEKSQETLEIYAPLANRFGLGQLKWELEDLGLKYLHPDQFDKLEKLVSDNRSQREELINQVSMQLRAELIIRGISADITGRPKHLYSIWKKLETQGKSFEELYDVLAIRVTIDSSDSEDFCELESDHDTPKCYEVMGVVHNLFKPIPGRFKDYIAMPKPNSYQSLHTAVVGPNGRPIEIQIRTRRMHHLAEYGIAAHWRYKEAGKSVIANEKIDQKLAWLQQLVAWQQDFKDAQEYVDQVKMDLLADEVFVFSPKGDVFDLPIKSTPVDFSYRIHTDVGHHTIGARVNDRIVPLNTQLRNGDIVEIITAKTAHPHMDWLNFAATHSAKHRIRQWFKKHHREDHVQQGKQALEAELGKTGLEEFLRSEKFKEIGKGHNLTDPTDFLAAIGYGDITVAQVTNRLREQELTDKVNKKPNISAPKKPSNVGSLSGLMHHLAKCCSPVPGEEVVGVVTRGSGIAVHRSDCSNLLRVDTGRHMPINWSQDRVSTYPASIKIETIDRVGIAGDILKKFGDFKLNLRDLRVEIHRATKTATIFMIIEVVDIDQLMRVCQSISQINDVIRVQRIEHRKKNGTTSNITPIAKSMSPRAKTKE